MQLLLAKSTAGVDYVLFRRPNEPASNPHKLALDHNEPITLTLSPTQTITVRAVDADMKPIAGAKVNPWYIKLPKHGDIANLGILWRTETNEQGIAKIDSIPIANTTKVMFWVRKEGYNVTKRTLFDPKLGATELLATLLPLVPVQGQVVQKDGSPAAGILVRVAGGGHSMDSFRETVTSTEDGTFSLFVNPNYYYCFAAGDESAASPIEARVIRTKSPEKIILKLQPATRVYGQVTTGEENRPVEKQSIRLYRHNDGEYYQLPKEEQLSNPDESRFAVAVRIIQSIQTDAEGRFEFFTGPGHHYIIGPSNSERPKFEIASQREIKADIHVAHLAQGKIHGRVVLAANSEQGAAAVKVFGYPYKLSANFLRATTNAKGYFECRRSGALLLVGAFSEDRRFGVVKQIEADADHFVLKLAPTTTLHGTLISEETGKPAANREISASIRVGEKGKPSRSACKRKTMTDEAGRFTIAGVVPGHRYELNVVSERNKEGNPQGWNGVGSVEPKAAGLLDVGERRLPAPYRPPTLEDHIARIYVKSNPAKQISKKLTDAKLSYQQVLLIVADQKSDAVKQFIEARRDYETKKNRDLRHAIANYFVIGIQPQQVTSLEPFGISQESTEAIYILDKSGKKVVMVPFKTLMPEGKLNRKALTEFLVEQSQRGISMPDASLVYAAALKQAKQENKRIFIQVSGPGCAPCVLLSRYLNSKKDLLAKEYVYLKLDSRMAHSTEIIGKVRRTKGSSVPWMVIFDANGKELATSDSDDGNIGFPSEKKGISHFSKMIRDTAQNLSDEEVAEILHGL